MTRLPLLAFLLLACAEPLPDRGADQQSIINGAPDILDPAVARITAVDSDGWGIYSCTGTLIAPDVIVTAAHCLPTRDDDPAAMEVFFGQNSHLLAEDPYYEGSAYVTEMLAHPRYGELDVDPLQMEHDIALFWLDREMHIEPVRIADRPEHDLLGSYSVLVGFGVREHEEGPDGEKYYAETYIDFVTDDNIFYGADGNNICSGDSGGPTLVSMDQEQRIAGVHSVGDCDIYGVATRIYPHLDWIETESGVTPSSRFEQPSEPTPDIWTDDTGESEGGGCAAGGATSGGLWLALLILFCAGRRRLWPRPVSHL